jgi:hypothetical protein
MRLKIFGLCSHGFMNHYPSLATDIDVATTTE